MYMCVDRVPDYIEIGRESISKDRQRNTERGKVRDTEIQRKNSKIMSLVQYTSVMYD